MAPPSADTTDACTANPCCERKPIFAPEYSGDSSRGVEVNEAKARRLSSGDHTGPPSPSGVSVSRVSRAVREAAHEEVAVAREGHPQPVVGEGHSPFAFGVVHTARAGSAPEAGACHRSPCRTK